MILGKRPTWRILVIYAHKKNYLVCRRETKELIFDLFFATSPRFLLNDQRDAQLFSMYLFIFITLYIFRAHRAHHQERQIVSIQHMVAVTLCRWPCRVQVGSELPTCTRHGQWQLSEVVLTQFVSPDDEHDVLENCRVKNINKYIEKNCASRWSFNKNRGEVAKNKPKINSFVSLRHTKEFFFFCIKNYMVTDWWFS
jgi:hypothetical protein